MVTKGLPKSSGPVAAFAAGLLLASTASHFVPNAAASIGPAAPTIGQLEQKIASLNTRLAAVETTNTVRPGLGVRPAPIKVTPAPGADQLTVLQQRVDALEATLFGPKAEDGRPRAIQSNVIGELQQRVGQISNESSDSVSKLGSVRNDLAAVHATLNDVGTKLDANGTSLTTLRGAFYSHRHHLIGAKSYGIVIGGVTRFVPASGGVYVELTEEPFCGDAVDRPACK